MAECLFVERSADEWSRCGAPASERTIGAVERVPYCPEHYERALERRAGA